MLMSHSTLGKLISSCGSCRPSDLCTVTAPHVTINADDFITFFVPQTQPPFTELLLPAGKGVLQIFLQPQANTNLLSTFSTNFYSFLSSGISWVETQNKTTVFVLFNLTSRFLLGSLVQTLILLSSYSITFCLSAHSLIEIGYFLFRTTLKTTTLTIGKQVFM